MSNVFGVRAGFDMDTSHVCPQGVLAVVTLMGVWLVLGDLNPVQGVRQDFLSAQWQSPPCQVPSCWSRSPEGQA